MPTELTHEVIKEELRRLARSSQMARSTRLVRFLSFTVTEALAGRADQITEHSIAVKVYDRNDDFDARADGIVRTEARRLRTKLNEYYRTQGSGDPIVIEYPVGSYAPAFQSRVEHEASDFLAGGGEMGERIRSFDWAATSLGPLQKWTLSLKITLGLCLRSRLPTAIYVGSELLFLYNDALRDVIGENHPYALGRPAETVCAEIWEQLGPALRAAVDHGEVTSAEDERFMVNLHGYIEERYYTFSISPVPDGSRFLGALTFVTETTTHIIRERRLRFLQELAACSTEASNLEGACQLTASVFRENLLEIPFAGIYLFDERPRQARLCGFAGVEIGTAISPPIIPLDGEHHSLFSKAAMSGKRQVLHWSDKLEPLPPAPLGGTPDTIVILPLVPSRTGSPIGFLIAGKSPYRKLDDETRAFLDLVAGHLSRVLNLAGERERARTLAEAQLTEATFFKNLSNEFRTDLTLIMNALDALDIWGQLPEDRRHLLVGAQRNGVRLVKMVDSLRDLSEIEAAKQNAWFQPSDLSALTKELADSFRHAIELSGLRFIVECAPLPELIFVDTHLWERIVLSLLSNAFKYTSTGEVGISLCAVEKQVDLTVWETGFGVGGEFMTLLFDPPEKFASVPARSRGSLGIDLMLVAAFAQLHGGGLKVSSELGMGSRFTVSILQGKDHLSEDRIRDSTSLRATRAMARESAEEALYWRAEQTFEGQTGEWQERSLVAQSGRRIMIALESRYLLKYVHDLLSEQYAVEAVTDGELLLARIQRDPPDLVLVDAMLPGLDGFALLRALRAGPATIAVPVILLSSLATEDERLRALAAGADEYLAKPFTSSELMTRVNGEISLSRARKQAREYEEKERNDQQATNVLIRLALDQMPGAVILFRVPSGEIVFSNKRAADLLGPGATITDAPFTESLRRGDPVSRRSIVHVRPDGLRLRLVASLHPIRYEGGEITASLLELSIEEGSLKTAYRA